MNIQGDEQSTSSDDDRFIATKSNSDILVLHEGKPGLYRDSPGLLKSIAVSDEGIVIAGFEISGPGLGVVLILNSFDLSDSKSESVWMSEYGTGVDITPDSSMIAIGSPKERTVYTYSLGENGSFEKEHKIKHYDTTSESFGFKVALAEDGKTIAVASPSTTLSSVQYGAIFVYVWIDDVWTAVAEILYGRNDIRRLGLGGIAIDAGLARVDAKDYNDNLYSFVVSRIATFSRKTACQAILTLSFYTNPGDQYENQCRDRHAFSEGIEGNGFRPQCKCMSGFESSNPAGGSALQTEDDVCIICSKAEECGDRPTSSPTFRPTLSIVPTTGPTLSKAPTANPTQSISPSSFPTTGSPTIKPTLSARPSLNPSSTPSTYGSIFDGEYCRFSQECMTFNCIDNICVGVVSVAFALVEYETLGIQR